MPATATTHAGSMAQGIEQGYAPSSLCCVTPASAFVTSFSRGEATSSVGQTKQNTLGVFGEVQNIGSLTVKQVELAVHCLDATGKSIFELSYTVPVSQESPPIGSHESRGLGLSLEDAPPNWNKTVDAKVTKVVLVESSLTLSSFSGSSALPNVLVHSRAS
jgi:hypothetical protein